MWYKYETHAHTSECSKCAKSPVEDMVKAYAAAGYTGMFFTDHYIFGNTCVPMDLPYNQFIDRYIDTYERGRKAGEKYGIDVFPGIEYFYDCGSEILILGIDYDFLRVNTDLAWTPVKEVCGRVRAAGGMTVRAHPFRHYSFIPQDVSIEYDCLDAIEVYNYFNNGVENELAESAAAEHGFMRFSGTDSHWCLPEHTAKAGVALKKRVEDGKEFVKTVMSGEYALIKNGQIITQ